MLRINNRREKYSSADREASEMNACGIPTVNEIDEFMASTTANAIRQVIKDGEARWKLNGQRTVESLLLDYPEDLVIKHRSGEIEFRLGARGSRGAITVLKLINTGPIPHFREGDKVISVDCGGEAKIDTI